MRNYQKEMLLSYIKNRFKSLEYNMAVGLLTNEEVLTIAVDDFIVDLFIGEEDFEGLERYLDATRECQNAD